MKLSIYKLVPILVLSLIFGGCSTLGGKDEASTAEGAKVTEAGGAATEEGGGAQTSAISEGAALSIASLDDPASPVYTKTIYFDYDISEIRADYRDVVAAHGELLAANPELKVTIEGHADERGSREYNIGLGERRANAVKRLLMAMGANESQIITISYGEERPAVLGASEAAWAKNRRAVFVY